MMSMPTNLVWFIELLVILKEVSGENCTGQNLSAYTGTVSTTNGGRICQRWTSNTPHSHMFNDDSYFPLDSSAEDAANYCRNTGQEIEDGNRPWCYTMDPRKSREYCNKPICGEPTCGGILMEPTGSLMSPDTDGDGEYDRDVDCLWTIVAPEDTFVEFEVFLMDIEPAFVACLFDFLAIYDSTGHYGRYCGTSSPPIIRSRSSTLYVRFFSDPEYIYPGFSANYSHVNATDNEGTTQSPEELPDYLVGDIMCPADVDIGLYTGNVNVTNTGRTCAHWIDLPYPYEGSSAEDKNYCRNFRYVFYQLPWCQTTDNRVELCMETICKGAPCGGNITTPSGWLSGVDRDGDGNYDIYRECLWTLIAPEDHGIVVKLLFLSLQESASCEFEILMIYVQFSEAQSFCGQSSSLPVTLRFSSNLLYVLFKSWVFVAPGIGFNLTYLHVAINSLTATLSEPAEGSTTWKERGPSSEQVTTTVTEKTTLTIPVTRFKKGSPKQAVNILGPTTLSGSTVEKTKTGSGCTKMSISNIPFKLVSVVWFIIVWG